MGIWTKNIRAFFNDLGEKFSDPAKLASLDVADLEKAIAKTIEASAATVGQPVVLESKLSNLKSREKELTTRLTMLAAADTEESRTLALKPATELAEVREDIEKMKEELKDATEAAEEWKAKIELFQSTLRVRRKEAESIKRDSASADAEIIANRALGAANASIKGSNMDGYRDKVDQKKAKAAGLAEINGLSDEMKERAIVNSAKQNNVLNEFFGKPESETTTV